MSTKLCNEKNFTKIALLKSCYDQCSCFYKMPFCTRVSLNDAMNSNLGDSAAAELLENYSSAKATTERLNQQLREMSERQAAGHRDIEQLTAELIVSSTYSNLLLLC